jgi:hypothetical protein
LPSIINFSDNDELIKLLELIHSDSYFYLLFDDAKKILIKNFIEDCPPDNLDLLADLIKIEDIAQVVKLRINKSKRFEFINYIEIPLGTRKIIREAIIENYLNSNNFDEANGFSGVVITIIPEMEKDELINLVKGISNNRQISNSFQVANVLRKIKSTKIFDDPEFINVWNESSLDEE